MYPENNVKKKSRVNKKIRPVRRVVGVIVFDGEKFLLLHRILNWSGWEFVKGGVEGEENAEVAIKRELFEETGIPKFELIGKVDEYSFLNKLTMINVHVKNYLVRVSSNHKISFENQASRDGEIVFEHDDYKWCFPSEALKLLTHNNSKKSLKKAIKLLGLD